MGAQPAQAEFERGVRLVDGAQVELHAGDRRLLGGLAGRGAVEGFEAVGGRIDAVDRGEGVAQLLRQDGARPGQRGVLHDPPPDRLAAEPLHQEGRAAVAAEVGREPVGARHAHARGMDGPQDGELLVAADDRAAERAAHVAAQHQRVPPGERPPAISASSAHASCEAPPASDLSPLTRAAAPACSAMNRSRSAPSRATAAAGSVVWSCIVRPLLLIMLVYGALRGLAGPSTGGIRPYAESPVSLPARNAAVCSS